MDTITQPCRTGDGDWGHWQCGHLCSQNLTDNNLFYQEKKEHTSDFHSARQNILENNNIFMLLTHFYGGRKFVLLQFTMRKDQADSTNNKLKLSDKQWGAGEQESTAGSPEICYTSPIMMMIIISRALN